jgi:hypothetical protein
LARRLCYIPRVPEGGVAKIAAALFPVQSGFNSNPIPWLMRFDELGSEYEDCRNERTAGE